MDVWPRAIAHLGTVRCGGSSAPRSRGSRIEESSHPAPSRMTAPVECGEADNSGADSGGRRFGLAGQIRLPKKGHASAQAIAYTPFRIMPEVPPETGLQHQSVLRAGAADPGLRRSTSSRTEICSGPWPDSRASRVTLHVGEIASGRAARTRGAQRPLKSSPAQRTEGWLDTAAPGQRPVSDAR